MRLRFSLRTFFVGTALIAVFCYYWLVLPSMTARQFVRGVAAKDYWTADHFFLNANDQFIDDWSDKHWAFHAEADLHKLTVSQLIRGERDVRISIAYFELDQNVSQIVRVPATPHGLKSPQFLSEDRVSITIGTDGASTDISR